ncbi:MAG: cellulase family glycosylhydrolase, partial [Roseburia sp.]|nr:cellulase family glycosylhydrolase [Roseburia sp.]
MKQKVRKVWACILVFALMAGLGPWPVAEVKAESSKSFSSDNGEVEITLTESKVNEYWCEYYLAVTNHSNQSIRDWQLTLSVNDISKYRKSFGCQATVKNDKLVVKGQGNGKVVAAGSTYKVNDDFKICFGGEVSFIGAEITYEYGSQSTGGNEGSVGSGATYMEGYQCNYTLTGQTKDLRYEDTPYGKHGALHVDGLQVKDKYNQPFTLRGASTHGMHWGDGETFLNKTAFQNLRDEWGVNMVRLVSYVTQGGYTQGSKDKLDKHIQEGVSDLTDLGMYAIIDWHVHAENPNDKKSEAIQFFDTYSKMYKDQSNIIYEICNEPTGTPWNQLRPYAVDVVKTIRANDPDAIIVVGTNTWSQDVDEVATNGGKLNDPNVMYTIHFYSGSHGESLREKVRTALKAGTPVFCTEFGVCDASGNGGFDLEEADRWIDFFEENGISYCCWSFSKKNESASMLSPECNKVNGFTNADLGATGAWLINTYRSRGGETPAPSVSAAPSAVPTSSASVVPSAVPTASASAAPSVVPTPSASVAPSAVPTPSASAAPSAVPTPSASVAPSASAAPSVVPTPSASAEPSAVPTPSASVAPSAVPMPSASAAPSVVPTPSASAEPSAVPTSSASAAPSAVPTSSASVAPSAVPTPSASAAPSASVVPSASATPVTSAVPTPSASATSGTSEALKPTINTTPGKGTTPSVSDSTNERGENTASEEDEELEVAVSASSYTTTVVDGVQGVEVSNFDSHKTTITIPDYITIKGKKYPVISIQSNAFAKCKKLTKVVIGKNVRRIKPKAFYNCKKLKTIVIKTKKLTMKRVGKKAFAGIYKKAKITLPKGGFSKKQKAAYKKILRARGVGK